MKAGRKEVRVMIINLLEESLPVAGRVRVQRVIFHYWRIRLVATIFVDLKEDCYPKNKLMMMQEKVVPPDLQ